MPLSVQHRHAVLLADRTHDAGVITTVVTEVLADNPETTPLEIEQAFRDSAAVAYLVATTDGLEIVLGMMAMLAALSKAGVTPEQNRAALAGKFKKAAPAREATSIVQIKVQMRVMSVYLRT